ncbi:tumor necrosis factor b (TNF superfamily, member 2) isoform X2 [Megalops cyprinoides]|nr:tumor necrosis factor b (TNF superfamily, member 2) isoform X2 [Megalops cyprinoides]
MAGYTATLTDVESGHRDSMQLMGTQGKPSGSWAWKVCGMLMLVALCGAAALFFVWHVQTQDKSQTNVIEPQPHTKGSHDPHHAVQKIAGNARAAIHLEGEFDPEVNKTSVLWRDEDGQSFYKGGLVLKDNEIIIPQSGLYFVYSQASFRVRCSPGDDRSDQHFPLTHTVMRWSDSFNDQKPLLTAVRSACRREAQGSDSTERWYNAVYLGAVFSLEDGDRLWTQTNRLSDVEGEDGKTFFGLFAL